jgi:ABC-type multidrug transport system fused ATPase/permease subunit
MPDVADHEDVSMRAGEELAHALRAVRYSFGATPFWAVASLALAVPSVFVPTVTLAATASAVSAAARGDSGAELASAVVLLIGAITFSRVMGPLATYAQGELDRRTRLRARQELVTILVRLRSLAPWDDRSLPDDASRAHEALSSLKGTATTARRAVTTLLGTLAPLGLLWRVGWWAPALVGVASIAAVVASVRSARGRRRTDVELVEQRRRATYYFDVSFDAVAAKENRVFGLGHWLGTSYSGTFDRYLKRAKRVYVRQLRDEGAAEVVRAAALGFVALVAVARAANGDLAAGDPAAVLGAIFLVQQNSQYLGGIRANLIINTEHLPALWRIHDAGRADAEALPDGDVDAPRPLTEGIRFEAVEFQYGTSTSGVLRGLDLFVPAGTSLALVGVNGAGKSTIVKLLCRGYDPSAGRITVDGVDLRDLRLHEWRDRLGVVFQDFVHFPLSAADNVSLTDHDLDFLETAAGAAGAGDIVHKLDDEWETALARDLGGTDLSGGEWQRIALARCAARVAQGADVLVLDEPTAALDVRTEADVVRQFRHMAEGRTTLLISHRLSTVKVADHIAVLEGGRVVEYGTHDELLAHAGVYAELWALQTAHLDEDDGAEPREEALR